MKKLIFTALFVFALIFGANSYAQGGQVVLPDPNAKLSETVNIEPVFEPSAIKPFEYQIRRGDNLTKLAKTFDTTVDELQIWNRENPDVKSKDLILAGGKLRVPLYSAESVEQLDSFYKNERITANRAYEEGQESMLPYLIGGFLSLAVIFFVLLSTQANGARNRIEVLATEFKHVHTKLGLAHEQLKLKEGADEEIKRLKTDNDRLVEKVSTLYMDNEIVSVNLAEAHAKVEALETALRKKVSAGDTVELDSREHGKIPLKVLKVVWDKTEGKNDVFVECPDKNCLHNATKDIKKDNALSHMASSGHWPTD